jgi:hypothetical protein
VVLIVVLRLFHIIGGAVWIGAVVVGVFFIEPAADTLGPSGRPFVLELLRRRLTDVMGVAATSAVLAGGALYWIDSGGVSAAWITSSSGLTFTVGGIAGLTAYVIAAIVLKPAFDRRATRREDASVSPGLVRRWSLIQVGLLVLALAAMSVGRYV